MYWHVLVHLQNPTPTAPTAKHLCKFSGLLRLEYRLVQMVDVFDRLVALRQVGHDDFACLGKAMANAHGVRSEDPAEEPRVIHGVFNIAPLHAANPFAPGQNAPVQPNTHVIRVNPNAFKKEDVVDAHRKGHDQNKCAGRHTQPKGRVRLSVVGGPLADGYRHDDEENDCHHCVGIGQPGQSEHCVC